MEKVIHIITWCVVAQPAIYGLVVPFGTTHRYSLFPWIGNLRACLHTIRWWPLTCICSTNFIFIHLICCDVMRISSVSSFVVGVQV